MSKGKRENLERLLRSVWERQQKHVSIDPMPISSEKTTKERIWRFVESPITWGGMGLLGGAVIVLVPAVGLKWVFVFTWGLVVSALLKEKFWEKKGLTTRIIGNTAVSIVFGIVFMGGWHYIPKPKDPPTAEEIAEAIVKKTPARAEHAATTTPDSPQRSIFSHAPTANEIAEEVMKKISNIPPINNNELRQEVAAYTKDLRELERIRNEAYQRTRRPASLQPGAEERSKHWFAVEDQVKERFVQDYRDKGMSLRDLMMQRLGMKGPPTPTILDDGVPINLVDIHPPCYEQLADYLDGLASRMKYP